MSDLTGQSVYSTWNRAIKPDPSKPTVILPTAFPSVKDSGHGHDEDPQCGLWKVWAGYVNPSNKRAGSIHKPLQIWLYDDNRDVPVQTWKPGLKLAGLLDHTQNVDQDYILKRWVGAKAITKAERDFHKANGKWPDEPEVVADKEVKAAAKKAEDERIAKLTAPPALDLKLESMPEPAVPAAAGSVPGHNSGETASFAELKSDALALVLFRNTKVTIDSDIVEAKAYYAKNKITTELEMHKAENWRKRIAAAGKDADLKRREEKKPLEALLEEIDNRWKPLVTGAKAQSDAMTVIIDAWAEAETKRKRAAAAAEAQLLLDKQREATRIANEAVAKQRAAEEAEHAKLMKVDPVAALASPLPEAPKLLPLPPVATPVLASVPKVMIGTQGARRSVKEAAPTAMITDLAKAAAYLASIQDQDLIKLIQKRADAAAKAKTAFPGCTLSYQQAAE